MRRAWKPSLFEPRVGDSGLSGVLQNESAQVPQKLGRGNEKIDDEATDETYNSSIT